MNVARKYGTTNPVLIEARINHDPYDQFAWVQDWRFSIAQYLTDVGEYVGDFRGADDIRDDFPYAVLHEMNPQPEPEELFYALKILDRYREWLGIAGKDY